jgi:hypothetical protein
VRWTVRVRRNDVHDGSYRIVTRREACKDLLRLDV